VYPSKLIPQRRKRVNYDLYADNGTTIRTYGWLPLSLNLGLRREFTWRFVVADVTLPIIGADFLSHFGLLVDGKNKRLLDAVESLSAPTQAASSQTPSVKVVGSSVDTLLSEFRDIIGPRVSSARCATTLSTTSGLHQAHQSPADHGDWHRTG
jgi:hypothetical protein